MKILTLIAALFTTITAMAQVGGSTMKFEYTKWDFGTINEADGSVSCVFKFRNDGNKPFVIENVSVSCGCTTPEFSKAPVMPGAEGTIKLTFDPQNRPGRFLKNVTITSDNRQNQNTLELIGTVIPRQRSVEENYPFELGTSPVRINDSERNFAYVMQGEVKSMSLGYMNTSDRKVVLEVRSHLPSNKPITTTRYEMAPREEGEITLTCDLRHKQALGMNHFDVEFYVDGKLMPRKFAATFVGVDNLKGANRDEAAKVQMDKMFHNFAQVKQGTSAIVKFKITNVGKSPLRISSCKGDGKVSVSLKAGDIIAPGASKEFSITVPTAQYNKGRLFTSVYLTMNDPVRPFRELRLVADIE